ncbi:MAG: DNA ligase-1 [Vicingaceae bacterium]|jgi:DNA ligase-1
MVERRKILEKLVQNQESEKLLISEVLELNCWEKLIEVRTKSRENNAEGLMLKRKESTYKIGRKKGDWWKWKVDPLTIDAVMIYAMRGHGRRANLYTDYTFAVWDDEKLVPFAKAYSGLTDKEINRVDAFVKKNTVDKFGPVRSVKPDLVFEIAFEGIAKSSRHKSGVALRFPRIHRWREDKPAAEANTLDDLMRMLDEFG